MEVVGAQARARRELGELRRLSASSIRAQARDRLDMRIGRAELVRPAALAGAEARLLRLAVGKKETFSRFAGREAQLGRQ